MSIRTVTVFGGTGFLGGEIALALIKGGYRVRIASRHPARFELPGRGDSWQPVSCDIREDAAVAWAVEGADAVVNAVSLYTEKGVLTFDAIHVHGAERIARCARDAGAQRLVLISGIGASTASPSKYVRARARGEIAVRQVFEQATILRPSVLYDAREGLVAALDTVTRLPVVPLFGRGRTRLQPVFVGDVAAAAERVLALPSARGRVFELGGEGVYTYRQLVRLVMKVRARKRLLLPFPFGLWHVLATLLGILPKPPITHDQLYLLQEDNVVGADVGTFADLAIKPMSLQAVLEQGRYRSRDPMDKDQ